MVDHGYLNRASCGFQFQSELLLQCLDVGRSRLVWHEIRGRRYIWRPFQREIEISCQPCLIQNGAAQLRGSQDVCNKPHRHVSCADLKLARWVRQGIKTAARRCGRAWWLVRVRLKPWPCFSRLRRNESEYRNLTGFKMNRQLESVCKQRLHHQAQLGFRRPSTGARLDIKSVRKYPLRQSRFKELVIINGKVICERDVLVERNSRPRKKASARNRIVFGTRRKIRDRPRI